ncbi:MAG: phage portal protein [Alphaproteobacteria bacterium]|nr:phage portal protein [Alphaproteobacteria bacterium]
MKKWIRSFLSESLQSPPLLKKASGVAPLIAYNSVGRPLWTPKRYDTLTKEGYQRNAIVYRCVNLIARGVASVAWLLYEQKQHEKHELEKHPVLDLLNCPSPFQAGSAFMESVVGYLLLSGNSYIEAVLDEDKVPIELHALRPDRMQVIPGKGGMVDAFEYSVGGHRKQLSVDSLSGKSTVLHLKSFHPLNDWYGMSPLEAAGCSIDQHNEVGSHNLALMQNGGRPSGALLIKPGPSGQTLTQEQRETLRQDLKDVYAGTQNAGKIMVFEGECDWREMGLSPKDLDFIEGKNLSAREIAQAFGVPPMLVGVPGDATFSNYKEARFHLWEDTIMPLLEFLVAEFNLWLLPYFGEDLCLGYDVDSIPALAPRREAAWNKIANADFLTLNEKRHAVGYSPIEGGDVLSF